MAVLIAAGVDVAPRRVAQTVRALGCIALVIGVVAAVAARVEFTPPPGHLRVVTPLVVGAIGLVLVAWGFLATVSARWPLTALGCAALLVPALGLRLLAPLETYAESRSARSIARNVPADSEVVCLQTFHTSLPFYLRRPVVLVSRDAHELTSRYVTAMRERFMGGPYLQPVERFAAVIADRDVVVLTKERTQDVTRLAKRPFVALYSQRRSLLLQPAS